ncbi:MAG: hypothetical protein JWQ72_2512 [Polaromonas sp.]|nr:hypothetical protein [Polaromonas sp.]
MACLAGFARVLLWTTVAAWVLLAAGWGVLHGWIVPRIGEFRPRLELEAGKVLGMPVRIGQITARSDGLIPSFELRDVVLLDARGNESLRLPRVLAALSPSSVWARGFEQLAIDQPALEIRRAADGKVFVGGLDISRGDSGGHAVADWIFSQTEISIQGGTVRWVDEFRSVPPLALTQVDAVLRNGRRSHAMRLDATPPAAWGDRFSLRGAFRQPLLVRDAGQWRDWSGEIYAAFDRVDILLVKQYVSLDQWGMDLRKGNGSLRAWGDVHKGALVGGTADVALAEVDVQLGKALQPLVLESITGRFGGRQLAGGFEFNTQGLLFSTLDGLRWPGGNLALVHMGTSGHTDQKTELKADRLDLYTLAQIANRLPLATTTHAVITSYAPKGLVETLAAQWQVPLQGSVTFSARGRVSGLEVASLRDPGTAAVPATGPSGAAREHPGRPGVSGATIDFDMTHAGGKAAFNIARGSLDLPGIFEDPKLALDSLSLEAQWKLAGAHVTDAQLRNIKFAGPDAAGAAQATWQSGGPSPTGKTGVGPLGSLDLQGTLSRGNGARVHRYLPLVLPDQVRHYVRDAVVEGELTDVKFRVKGPVDRIPYADPSLGEFRISAKVKKGTFAYVPKSVQRADLPAWPALTDVQGELLFDHAALDINNVTARVAGLGGLQVQKADARIPDLMHTATVEVRTSLKGPLADALGFVNSSPVGSLTGQVLRQAVATGSADYGLHLTIPLTAIDKTRIQGTVTLPGNDVQFLPASPVLARLKGEATFSESGFNIAAAQAKVLGGDIRFEGGMRAPPRAAAGGDAEPAGVMFRAQGTVTAEGLRQARDLGPAAQLGQYASGSTAYQASLGFRRGTAEVTVSTNLQGMALTLPAPLGKGAEGVVPVHFEKSLLRESMLPGQKLQDQLALNVGRVAAINYVRDISGSEARVVRGSVGVGLEPGESVPAPDAGVAASINLASVDLDAWARVLSSTPPGTGAAAVTAPGPARPVAAATSDYLPTRMAIRAKELLIDGRTLHNVVAGGSRDGLNWRANIDATELNGYVEFRQPGGAGAGRVYARLSRLSLAQGAASDVESILDEQPSSIPALDIVVEDLELRGKRLGRIEIDAINRGTQTVLRDGGVREWRLNKFNIILPEAVLTASGNWVAVNAQTGVAARPAPRAAAERRRTVMNFKLDIADSGELLKRFGMDGVIRRGKGKLEGQVAWVGSPLSMDDPSLNGQFNVNIESGQFLKADPGLAKLLGVLSLQALPRRLTLDFRDVFSEVFSFDFVRGDVNISQGLAATNNLQMKGVNAAVLMEGNADIARETQDLKVVVVPEINAGTASLIATVINPAIGLGTFLAQYFLRRPLIQATTQEFHIDGSWADPKITRVERKP